MREIDDMLKDAIRIAKGCGILAAVIIAVILLALLLAGCGHNTGAFQIGTRFNAGLDPQNATANISYIDGLNVVDVSRENSSWDIHIDADNGVSYDSKTGTIKGVKRLRREIGPQITGRLVELAEKDPEMARMYVEAVRNYWQYRNGGKAAEKQ
jgi:hypothetical protein